MLIQYREMLLQIKMRGFEKLEVAIRFQNKLGQ